VWQKALLMVAGPVVALVGKKAYEIYDNMGNDESSGSVNMYFPSKQRLSDEAERELLFSLAFQWAAISCNGEIHEKEERFFSNVINVIKVDYECTDEFLSRIDEIKSKTPDVEELKQRFMAVKHNIDPVSYENTLHNAVSSDGKIDDFEKAFLFRSSLLLRGLDDIAIYKYSTKVNASPTEYLEHLNDDIIKSKFPYTELDNLRDGGFLTEHPGNRKRLIPLDEMFSEEFAISKDTELISAARLAGAKFVTIESFSSANRNRTEANKILAAANVSYATTKVEGSIESLGEVKNISRLEEGECIRFEFEGNRPPRWRNWLGWDRNSVLRSSKWIRFDPIPVEFVNGCFGANRTNGFEYQISYRDIDNVMRASSFAVKAGLTSKAPVKVSANGGRENSHTNEKDFDRRLRYRIEFN